MYVCVWGGLKATSFFVYFRKNFSKQSILSKNFNRNNPGSATAAQETWPKS